MRPYRIMTTLCTVLFPVHRPPRPLTIHRWPAVTPPALSHEKEVKKGEKKRKEQCPPPLCLLLPLQLLFHLRRFRWQPSRPRPCPHLRRSQEIQDWSCVSFVCEQVSDVESILPCADGGEWIVASELMAYAGSKAQAVISSESTSN